MDNIDRAAKVSWALLPPSFRRIWLEMALDNHHGERNGAIGYVLVVPLTDDGAIDVDLWHQFHEFCGVIRFRPGEANDIGHLVHKAEGTWAFCYDVTGKPAHADAYCLGAERFVTGDSAWICDDGGLHSFQVASIEPI